MLYNVFSTEGRWCLSSAKDDSTVRDSVNLQLLRTSWYQLEVRNDHTSVPYFDNMQQIEAAGQVCATASDPGEN
jgi:hypothetical protein